jgi:hypothetical protein
MSERSCSPFSWMVSTNSFCSGVELARDPLGEHLAVADDRRERRAELVAHRGEEVRLEAVELLQAVVGLLELLVLLLELAVALLHAREVHRAREERLVPAEEDEIERRLEVRAMRVIVSAFARGIFSRSDLRALRRRSRGRS